MGCGQVLNKRDMVRVVRTPGGEVMADPSGKAAGRGAYLHAQAECWETGLKKGRLAHSLKVTVSPANADALREYARGLGLVEVTS